MSISLSKVLGFYLLIMTFFVLWPYKFSIPHDPNICNPCINGAAWVSKRSGIDLKKPGILRSISPPVGLHDRLLSGSGLTIEAWLTTAALDQVGPARILSYSQDPYFRNFTLGQENDDLIFRLRTTETDLNGLESEITVPRIFLPGKRQHIVVTYDFSHFRAYVDGQLSVSVRGPGGTLSNWDRDYRLLIGNEQTGNRPWIGSLNGVALYNRAISMSEVTDSYKLGGLVSDRSDIVAFFDFAKGEGKVVHDNSGVHPPTTLEIPQLFTKEISSSFFSSAPRDFMDFASNFGIFFPLGFLLLLYFFRSFGKNSEAMLSAIIVTALFSLIAESLQYFVDARTSSLVDFGGCLTGGLAGSVAAIALGRFVRVS